MAPRMTQPLPQYLSSELATRPIAMAGRGHLAVFEARVICLPVYLCPLHCPVMINAPAPDCL